MSEQGPLPAVAGEQEDAQRHGLTVQEREQVEQIKRAVDVTDPQEAMQYGLPAQTKIATFADTLLADVRAKDTGETGEALSELVAKVRDLDVGGLGGSSSLAKVPLVGRFVDSFNRFVARYRKIGASIEQLTIALERARMDLLKDITVLEKMYELNLDYLRQLDLYVTAGEEILEELRTRRLPVLEAEVRASGAPLLVQQLADFRQAITRFERRLHDLRLTRTIAIQSAPQIRLIQGNDQNLVEKIQSSLLTTIPLWKNQVVIAISLFRQQKAVELQREVSDATDELLARNAALLKEGSGKVAEEVERGVVDVATLQKVNDDLIATLEETLRIQEAGHSKRLEAEQQLAKVQSELRQKLISLRGVSAAEEESAGR
ncbi:MAG: toxic anion resistance protein [Actinobacteria bacterium]|nr:toxic anion resistance protein [Actinomycetota bacterium]